MNVPNGDCSGGLVNIDAAHDKKTYAGFKSRANVTWHITPDIMAYYTFSQGFRPGAFNRSVSNVAPGPGGIPQFTKPNGYGPDSLQNQEIGMKGTFLDNRLQVNLSAYLMQWNNVQFLFFNPPYLGNTTFGINGPDYHVKGVEGQVEALITDGLSVEGSGSYNDDTQAGSPCLVSNNPASPTFGSCITQIIPKGERRCSPSSIRSAHRAPFQPSRRNSRAISASATTGRRGPTTCSRWSAPATRVACSTSRRPIRPAWA